MVLLSRNKLVSPIGLDFGPRHVRAAQLERSGDRWTLLRASCWAKRDDEADATTTEGFLQRVRRSMEHSPFQGRGVIGGLSVPEVEVHPLEIPEAGELQYEERFADAVRWEMQRFISIPLEQTAVDYWRIPRVAGSRTTAIGVAAKRTQVEALSHFADHLGWDCERVDATPCALARLGTLLRRRPGADPKAIWGVLDAGFRLLRLVVCVDEQPVLVRTLGNGGQAWTEAIASGLGLSIEAAEIHKQDHGIVGGASDKQNEPIPGRDKPESSSQIGHMIHNILSPDLAAVVNEIERSYEYVMRCFPERNADELVLVGGGAQLRNLAGFLKQTLGIDVVRVEELVARADSPLTCDPASPKDLSSFAAAIGLAIDPGGPP